MNTGGRIKYSSSCVHSGKEEEEMDKLMRTFKDLDRNKAMLIMVLPGTLWFLLFSYLPMA